MASEIRVNKLNSQTGVGTITLSPTGVDISGITTAETLKATTGIVTTLTATTGIVTTFEATTGNITTLRSPTGIVTSLEATTGDITTLRAPTGIVTTFVTNTANVGAAVTINSDGVVAAGIAVTCGSINGAPIGRKNVLINGAFNVWQRGTSVTMLNSAKAMLCDRWTGSINYQAGRHSRQSLSGAIAGQGGTYCLRVGSSNGTSTRITAGQYIESINATPLAGRECTLSFYIKFSAASVSASSGAYAQFFSFSNYYTGVDAASYSTSPAGTATHNEIFDGSFPTTWTKYTKTFTPPSNMRNMTVSFSMSGLGQTSSDDDFYYELSNVQLELGSQATPFEHTSYGEDLTLCQRYFQLVRSASATGVNGNTVRMNCPLLCEMRAEPSLGKGGSGNINVGDMVSVGSNTTQTPSSDGYQYDRLMMSCQLGGFTGLTAYRTYCHEPAGSHLGIITCDAEL